MIDFDKLTDDLKQALKEGGSSVLRCVAKATVETTDKIGNIADEGVDAVGIAISGSLNYIADLMDDDNDNQKTAESIEKLIKG